MTCSVNSPINFVTAALGGEREVPTLLRRVKLKIPTKTQIGKQFRLRGMGVRSLRGGQLSDWMCSGLPCQPDQAPKRDTGRG